MSEVEPCAHCGWPKSRLMHKTQYRLSKHGYVAYEWVPDTGFGGDYEREVYVLDFRHRFYVRCNKCGARGGIASTDWYVTTEEEAEEWSRLQPTLGHEWDSDFAKDARDRAIEAWNRRANDAIN